MASTVYKIVKDLQQVQLKVPESIQGDIEDLRREIIGDVERQGIKRRIDVWQLLIERVPLDTDKENDCATDAGIRRQQDKNRLSMLQIFCSDLSAFGQIASWNHILDQLSIPDGYLRLFKLCGVPGDEWKNSGLLRNRALMSLQEGGLGLNEQQKTLLENLVRRITRKFGSYPTFVAKMEGKEEAEPSIPQKVRACGTPEELLNLLSENGIKGERWRDFLSLEKQKGEGAQLIRAVLSQFGSVPALYIAFMEGRWRPDFRRVEEMHKHKKADFLSLFQQLDITGYCRDQPRLKKEAEENIERFNTPEYKPIAELLMVANRKCRSYNMFIRWMDGRVRKGSWTDRIEQCKAPLDFLVLFIDEGVPEGKWENSEWLSSVARLSPEEGGINNNLSACVSAIRKRFNGSYPEFVNWMYGGREEEEPIAVRVEKIIDPEDAEALYRELQIPEAIWFEYMRLEDLAKERSKGKEFQRGIETKIYGFLQAVIKRWGEWRNYVAWFEGKDKPEERWVEKVNACKDRGELLQLFRKEGIPGNQWRNSFWLGKQSRLPKSQGGVGRNLRGLRNALMDRFTKWTKFLEYMDGMPEEGIISTEIAVSLLQNESKRLCVPTEELLDPTGARNIISQWRASPVLVKILEHCANQLPSTMDSQATITVQQMLDELQLRTRSIRSHQQDSDIDLQKLEAFYQLVNDRFMVVITEHGDVHSEEEMEELCKKLYEAMKEISVGGLPKKRLHSRISYQRNRARTSLAVEAKWQREPIRTGGALTGRGRDALNVMRSSMNLQAIPTKEDTLPVLSASDPSLLSAENIKALENIFHIDDISEIDYRDDTQYTFTLKNRDYCDSQYKLVGRFAVMHFSSSKLPVRFYFAFRKAGRQHEDAKKLAMRDPVLLRACLDGRLPMDGFTSEDHAFEFINKEILRLKAAEELSGSDRDQTGITAQDYDAFLRMSNDNIVLRDVERFFEDTEDKRVEN